MNNKVENINIEKNKELFEYEMTEVILKLKGEFAAFSGKDTRFEEMAVDDKKLHICTPEVIQVQMRDCNVQVPEVGRIQPANPALVEVKSAELKLPSLTQILGEDTKQEDDLKTKRVNVWQEIALPVLPAINIVTIANSSSEQTIREVEKEIISSVEIPRLFSVMKSTRRMKEKEHTTPISVCVPKLTMKCDGKHTNFISDSSLQNRNTKDIPEVDFNSEAIADLLKKISKPRNINTTDVRVPYVVKSMAMSMAKSKLIAERMVDVEETDTNRSNVKVLPTITHKAVMVNYPLVPAMGMGEMKKTVEPITMKPLILQIPHSFKFEFKNPIVINNKIAVPELKDIKISGINSVHISGHPILTQNTPYCHVQRKSVTLKYLGSSVMVPNTEIQNFSKSESTLVRTGRVKTSTNIPKVSIKPVSKVKRLAIDVSVPLNPAIVLRSIRKISYEKNDITASIPNIKNLDMRPIAVGCVSKFAISIPSTVKPQFSVSVPRSPSKRVELIEVPKIMLNGNISKVNVTHFNAIDIPKKPEVGDTVDSIIALAVPNR